MADDQIINVIINAITRGVKDSLNDLKTLDNVFGDLEKSSKDLDNSTKQLNDTNKSFTQNLRDRHAAVEKELRQNEAQIASYQKQIGTTRGLTDASRQYNEQQSKNLRREAERHSQLQDTLAGLNEEHRIQTGKTIPTLQQQTTVMGRLSHAIRGNSTDIDKNRNVIGRMSQAWRDAGKELQKDDSIITFLGRSSKEATQDFNNMFRAARGIAFAGIAASINPLLSAITALAGQAIALGGSLIYAGSALGGAFIAGIAQAIPVAGIFAAVMSRLSSVMNAVNEHFLVQKQNANQSSTAMQAQKTAAQGVADAQRGVADAQRGVDAANRQVTQSEQALNQARQDAQRQVQDLMFAERDEELQLKSSILSRKEAQQQLQDAIQQGADPLQIAQLKLQLQQAGQDVKEQRVQAQRASADANEARQKGIKSIDSYVSAQRALADAHRGVSDAQRSLADSQRQLTRAEQQATTATQDQSSAQSYLKYFMSQLSASEKELYHSIIRVREFFKTQFTSVTDPIIQAFSKGIDRGLAFIKDPKIFSGLKTLSKDIAGALNEITGFITNPAMKEFFSSVMEEAGRNIPILVQGFEVLARIFRNIATAAAPVLTKFLHFLVNQLKDFNAEISNKQALEDFFTTGFKFFRAWFNVVTGLLNLIGALMGVSKGSAFQTLKSFADTLNGAAADIRDNGAAASQFFDETANSLSVIGQILVDLGKGLYDAFNPAALEAFRQILHDLIIPALVLGVKFSGYLIEGIAKLLAFADKFKVFGISLSDVVVGIIGLNIALKATTVFFGLFFGKLYQTAKAIEASGIGKALIGLKNKFLGVDTAAAGDKFGGPAGKAPPQQPTKKAEEGGSKLLGAAKKLGPALGGLIPLVTTFSVVVLAAAAALAVLSAWFFAIKDNWLGLRDAIVGVGLSAWHDLAGAANDLADSFGALGQALGFDGGIVAKGADAIANAFGDLWSIIQPLVDAVGHLVSVFGVLKVVALGPLLPLVAFATLSFKALTFQIRAAAFVIGKIVDVLTFVVKRFKDFIDFFQSGKIKDGILGALKFIWDHSLTKLIFQGLVAGFKLAINFIKNIPNRIAAILSGGKTAMFDAGKALFNALGKGIEAAVLGVKNAIVGALDTILGLVQGFLGGIGDVLSQLPDISTPLGDVNLGGPGDAISGAADSIGNLRDQLTSAGQSADQNKKSTLGLIQSVIGLGKATTATNKAVDISNNSLGKNKDKADKATKSTSDFKNTTDDATKKQKDFGKETDDSSGKLDKFGGKSSKARGNVGKLKGTLDSTGRQSRELGRLIGNVTDNILDSFGAKKLNFTLPSPKTIGDIAGTAAGIFGLQKGGWFGNADQRGRDDRLIGVAGGEAILTGWHQKAVNGAMGAAHAMGLSPYGSLGQMFNRDKREHRTAPKGYAKGGYTWPSGSGDFALGPQTIGPIKSDPDHQDHVHVSAINIPWLIAFGHKMQQIGNIVGEFAPTKYGNPYHFGPITTQEHAHYPTDHYSGHAIDINDAQGVENTAWESAIAKVLGGGKISGAIGGAAQLLNKINIKGPKGPLRDMLQNQADTLRKAANKLITKKTGGVGITGEKGAPIASLPKSLEKYNRQFPDSGVAGGYQMPATKIAELAEWAGRGNVPGWTMEQVTIGESNRAPGAHGIDPGGTQGYGLWQITTGYNDALIKSLGGVNAMLNPVLNAQAMASIYGSQGLGAWYGTSAVTDSNRHYTGSMKQKGGFIDGFLNSMPGFDMGGIVPGRRGEPRMVMAHGGEVVLPTHKNSFQTGGVINKVLKTSADPHDSFKAFYDTIEDLEKKKHIEDALKSLTELLRDGGIFDDIATAVEAYTTYLTRKTLQWTYKIRKGIVGQVKSNVNIAERNLDDLEKEYKKLAREQGDIAKVIRRTQKKLKDASKAQRDKLKSSLELLGTRAGDIQDLINQNIQDQVDAQNAVLQAAQDRIQQRLDKSDLQLQIIQAQAALSGKPLIGQQKGVIKHEGDILQDQRKELEKALKDARKSGDKEAQRDLQNQLLANKLAILQNTQALKDVAGSNNKIVDFNSTAWDLWRKAIFNGQGGIIPSGMPVPSLQSGGHVVRSGLVNLHAGEVVHDENAGNGTINVNITEPMEVADPTALSNAIAWKLKTKKAVSR